MDAQENISNIQEKEQKEEQIINVNVDNQQIADTLKAINTTLNRHNQKLEYSVESVDNSINLVGNPTKRVLVDDNNKQLNDYEVCKRALSEIEKDRKAGKKLNINPKFIDFMKDMVNYVDNGGSVAEYKERNIYAPNIENLQF